MPCQDALRLAGPREGKCVFCKVQDSGGCLFRKIGRQDEKEPIGHLQGFC